jgi:hypothetical protein
MESEEEYKPEPSGIGPDGLDARDRRAQRRQDFKDRSEVEVKSDWEDTSPRSSTPMESEVDKSLEPALGGLSLDTSNGEPNEWFDATGSAPETGEEHAADEHRDAPELPEQAPSQELPEKVEAPAQAVIGPAREYAKSPELNQSEMGTEAAGPSTSQASSAYPSTSSARDERATRRWSRRQDVWVPREKTPYYAQRVTSPLGKRSRPPSSPPSSPEITKRAKPKYWKPKPEFPPLLTTKSKSKSKKKGRK